MGLYLVETEEKRLRRPRHSRLYLSWLQGMIALRRGATELTHEDYMEGILEVQAKKKANLQYYA
jgi:hypothetical protein